MFLDTYIIWYTGIPVNPHKFFLYIFQNYTFKFNNMPLSKKIIQSKLINGMWYSYEYCWPILHSFALSHRINKNISFYKCLYRKKRALHKIVLCNSSYVRLLLMRWYHQYWYRVGFPCAIPHFRKSVSHRHISYFQIFWQYDCRAYSYP